MTVSQRTRPVSKMTIKRRTFFALAGGTVISLALRRSGVLAAAPRLGKRTLVMGQYAEPLNLNPIIENVDRPADQIMTNVYGTLISIDYRTGQALPGLATKWTRTDPKTWVFQLREGVHFHKGYGEFTAEDVEFFANYIIDGKKPLYFRYSPVESVKAMGKYTVEYKTKEPFAPLPWFVGTGLGSFIVSKRAFKELGSDEAYGRTPIGTGPFEFSSWQRGSQILLKRNTQHWRRERPYLEELVFRPIPDSFVRRSLLKTGDIDMLDAPDYKDVADFRRDPRFIVGSIPGWNFDYIQANIQRSPLNNKKVRQAIAHAIDRDEIVRSVCYGEAAADDGPLPPGSVRYLVTTKKPCPRTSVDSL